MSDAKGILSFADAMSPKQLIDYALRVEELGYESIWLPDLFGREIFLTAGYVLENTTRLRVATGIAHVYARDAISTAQAARTLAELYPGRFLLGLGVSHPQAAELRGHVWIPPVRKLRAYLEGMAAADIRSPAPERAAPIYIAAHGPKLLALAAESTDGANTYLMPPEHTRQAREILGSDKSLNVVLPCCLCEDEERAREIARRGLSVYLGLPAYQRQWVQWGFDESDFAERASDRLVDGLVAWGDESAIRGRIAAHMEAGASEIEVVPYNPRPKTGIDWALLTALAR
jgi:probable F420-dependent oxidoreductase